ncbi:ABC transporter substrate-binding protein [Rhodoplanes sp. Z2-YC6860]|uniref:ABC transporter substrate-binding protein n=1 Tax=Rhodoplanes sp. Z2-YC6860 TaxID=674703 RepID=UPI000833B635|nr:ABC transporter substrate-binding protein [Rhodoplanes sp. Z2-YC6860]
MQRRELMVLLGNAAVMPLLAPLTAFGQEANDQTPDQMPAPPTELPSPEVPLPPERVRRLGVLTSGDRHDRDALARLDALQDGLAAKGWTHGRNLQIEARLSAAGDDRGMTQTAKDLAGQSPDILVAVDRVSAEALAAAAGNIPVVFVNVVDPAGVGLVKSLEQPGGNITGVGRSEYGASISWPEMLKLIAPNVMRVAIIRDPDATTDHGQIAAISDVAPALGIEAFALDADSLRDLERAITGFSRTPNGGLIVTIPESSSRDRSTIVRLAARFKLPAIYADRQFVTSGGLMSYGPDQKAEYRLAADYVDRILKGDKPADLPVQTASGYQLVINRKTARALGLNISPTLSARASELIS